MIHNQSVSFSIRPCFHVVEKAKNSKITSAVFALIFCLGVILAATAFAHHLPIYAAWVGIAFITFSVLVISIQILCPSPPKKINSDLRQPHANQDSILDALRAEHLFSDVNTLFLRTYLAGNFEQAEVLLTSGADVNTTDAEGRTIFHLAVERWHYLTENHLAFLKICAKKSLDINQRDNKGNSPLDLMAKENCIDSRKLNLFEFFAELGADFYSKDDKGRCALHYAASNTATVGLLCEFLRAMPRKKPENFDWSDIDGNTPLHIVCSSTPRREFFPFFDEMHKIDPLILNVQNEKGQTFFHILICRYDQLEDYAHAANGIRTYLAKGGDWRLTDHNGKNGFEYAESNLSKVFNQSRNYLKKEDYPFLYERAVERKNAQFLRLLLEANIPYSESFDEESLLLASALEIGHLPSIGLLIHFLSIKKDVKLIYDTSLQVAANKGGVYERVFDLCHQEKEGLIFENFFKTASNGNESGFDFYVEADFSPNEWREVLYLAARSCQFKIVKKCTEMPVGMKMLLHSVGADKKIEGQIGETIEALVKMGVKPDEISMSTDLGNFEVSPLEWFVYQGDEEAVKALLKYQVSLDRAFLIAVIHGNISLVRLLKEQVADFKKLSLTVHPLHVSCMYGHKEIAVQLIEWGADTTQIDEYHKFYWQHFKYAEQLSKFVQLLREAGQEKIADEIKFNDFKNNYLVRIPQAVMEGHVYPNLSIGTLFYFLNAVNDRAPEIPVQLQNPALNSENLVQKFQEIKERFDFIEKYYHLINHKYCYYRALNKLDICPKYNPYIRLKTCRKDLDNLTQLYQEIDCARTVLKIQFGKWNGEVEKDKTFLISYEDLNDLNLVLDNLLKKVKELLPIVLKT